MIVHVLETCAGYRLVPYPCRSDQLYAFFYTLDGSKYCEWGELDEPSQCGTAEVTKTSATITMPNDEENECEIIELTK